jgi:hypothetical protein
MMQIVFGDEFRFTQEAKSYVVGAVTDILKKNSEDFLYPIFGWSWKEFDPSGNRLDVIPGPVIQFDNNIQFKEKMKHHYEIEKYEIKLNLNDQLIDECRQKILDYRKGQLVLIFENDLY